jgi:glycosyltransferase involved in cell wall biosynthesis
LQDCVRFVGQVPWDESLGYLAGFDLGFMNFSPVDSDRMFGSPLKLYEYMAMELPVVSSQYADAKEMIIPGRTGYLFEPGDKESLKRAMHLAWRNRASWKEIGKAARKQVIEKASWESRVRMLIYGVEHILEGKCAHPSA